MRARDRRTVSPSHYRGITRRQFTGTQFLPAVIPTTMPTWQLHIDRGNARAAAPPRPTRLRSWETLLRRRPTADGLIESASSRKILLRTTSDVHGLPFKNCCNECSEQSDKKVAMRRIVFSRRSTAALVSRLLRRDVDPPWADLRKSLPRTPRSSRRPTSSRGGGWHSSMDTYPPFRRSRAPAGHTRTWWAGPRFPERASGPTILASRRFGTAQIATSHPMALASLPKEERPHGRLGEVRVNGTPGLVTELLAPRRAPRGTSTDVVDERKGVACAENSSVQVRATPPGHPIGVRST